MMSLTRWLRTLLASRFVLVTLLISLAVSAIILVPIGAMIVRYQISVEHLMLPLIGFPIALAFGYGLIRGTLFHPALDPNYYEWLSNSPWTPECPLPKGPVHLVWFDAVIVGGLFVITTSLALTMATPSWHYVVGPLIAFAFGLAVAWMYVIAFVGESKYFLGALAAPLALAILPVPPIGFIITPVIVAVIAWFGIRRTLDTFPWKYRDILKSHTKRSLRADASVGWPFNKLQRKADEFCVSKKIASLEAAIAGGWVWHLLRYAEQNESQGELSSLFIFAAFGSLLAASSRLIGYSSLICSSLCWGLRVAKKQWIIPRHDQVFIAPLLILLAGWGLPWVLHYGVGFSVSASLAISVAVVVFITRGLGPSIRELQFTGVHSMSGALSPLSKDFITTRGTNS